MYRSMQKFYSRNRLPCGLQTIDTSDIATKISCWSCRRSAVAHDVRRCGCRARAAVRAAATMVRDHDAAPPSRLKRLVGYLDRWRNHIELIFATVGKEGPRELAELQAAYDARLHADGIQPLMLPNKRQLRPLLIRPNGLKLEWLGVDVARIEFALPPGTYATMALRELLHGPVTE